MVRLTTSKNKLAYHGSFVNEHRFNEKAGHHHQVGLRPGLLSTAG